MTLDADRTGMDLTSRPLVEGRRPEKEWPEFMQAANPIIWGPDGLRVAWRLPIALCAWFVVLIAAQTLLSLIPGARALIHAEAASGQVSPGAFFLSEGPELFAALAAMGLMSKIEGRSFAEYYLPGREAFGKRFWQGLLYGLLIMSLLMAT